MQEHINIPSRRYSGWTIFLFIVASLVSLSLIGAIYLIDFDIAKLLGRSALAGLGLFFILSLLLKRMKIENALALLMIVAFVSFTGFASYKLFSLRPIGVPNIPSCKNIGETKDIRELSTYEAVVKAEDLSTGKFTVEGSITFDLKQYTCQMYDWEETKVLASGVQRNLPKIEVVSISKGYFLNEVSIPLENWSFMEGMKTHYSDSKISIQDLLYHSFYDAEYVDDIKVNEYMGKETITWEISYTQSETRFVYIRPPYQNLRSWIVPLIEISKYDNTLLAIIGFIFPFILFSIISPVVIGAVQNKLRDLFKKPALETPIKSRPKKNNPN